MKKILYLLGFLFGFTNIYADNIIYYKICVYDECTGEPIPGWTVTLIDQGPKGPLHYKREFITDWNGCIQGSWAADGDVGFYVKNGDSWNVKNNFLHVSTSVIPITGVKVVERDDQGNPISTTTLKESRGCKDWIYTSNVISECNNPSINFSVPATSDARNYCYENKVIDCSNEQIVASVCGDLDFSTIFDGLSAGKYTIQTFYGCCGNKFSKCPEDPQGPIERTIRWQPSVDFGDVDFDWMASPPIEQANNEAAANRGDNRLFTDDHPFPSLGENTVGVDLDLSGISSNATELSVTLTQFIDCNVGGPSLYSETWSTNGNVPSTLNFNQLTLGYFLMGQGYVKGETCFEFCFEAGDGNCSVKKCGTFRIEDNCPWCFKGQTTSNLQFVIAPNPVSDYLYLRANDESLTLSIIDMMGRQVYYGAFTQSLDATSWNTGFYFARYFDSEGNSHLKKFFKQ